MFRYSCGEIKPNFILAILFGALIGFIVYQSLVCMG